MDHLTEVKCDMLSCLLCAVDHTDRGKVAVKYIPYRSGCSHVIGRLGGCEITFHRIIADELKVHVELCQVQLRTGRCAADTDVTRIDRPVRLIRRPCNSVH